MANVLKIATEDVAKANKNKEFQTDKEASATLKDSIVQCRILLARLINTPNPANPSHVIQTVHLPEILPIFLAMMETSKLSDASRMFQDQFAQHLCQSAVETPLAQDANINFNVHSLDAAMVGALSRANWNNVQLNLDPLSIKRRSASTTLHHIQWIANGGCNKLRMVEVHVPPGECSRRQDQRCGQEPRAQLLRSVGVPGQPPHDCFQSVGNVKLLQQTCVMVNIAALADAPTPSKHGQSLSWLQSPSSQRNLTSLTPCAVTRTSSSCQEACACSRPCQCC
jgi:hypothetical protein